MKKFSSILQKSVVFLSAFIVLFIFIAMIFYVAANSIPALRTEGLRMFDPGTEWRPVSQNPTFGLLPVIFGTLYVSFIAMGFAMFFGVGCAFFLQYYMRSRIRTLVLSLIDSVAGVPSVIFGFIGLTVVVRFFAKNFSMAAGQCVLAAGLVLGVMLIPFVVSTTFESITQARAIYEPSALSLGFTKEITMIRIILPSIRTGLISAAMMALGRGLGETMAVMMVIGNSPIFPKLFGRGQTIPALTALEMGSIEYGSLHLSVLYAANGVLLILLFLVLGTGYWFMRKGMQDEGES